MLLDRTEKWFLPTLLLLIGSAGAAWLIATIISGSDFPVYYSAARQLLEPGSVVSEIYNVSSTGQAVDLPEKYASGNYFIYSPVIAFLLSPLALLPYYVAKSVLIFFNIAAYGVSVALLLNVVQRWSWRAFWSGGLLFWMPFVVNACVAQVNALLLLCTVGAIFYAGKNRPVIAGSLLGFAGLFKIFPLGFAFLLGKSAPWLLLGSVLLFGLGLLCPGTLQWFEVISTVSAGHTPIYLFAQTHGIAWQLLFSGVIVGCSLFCLTRARTKSLRVLFAYAVPATLAAMPVVQYHHLVLLVIPFLIIWGDAPDADLSSVSSVIMLGTALHINLRAFWAFLPEAYWSLLAIWGMLSWYLYTTARRVTSATREWEG